MKEEFEYIVNGDSTLRYFVREARFDFNKLDSQVNIRASAILTALDETIKLYRRKYID